jgi:hypothetical protein
MERTTITTSKRIRVRMIGGIIPESARGTSEKPKTENVVDYPK